MILTRFRMDLRSMFDVLEETTQELLDICEDSNITVLPIENIHPP